jgi:hypothetical protein
MLEVNRNVYKDSLAPIKGIISEWMCQISKKAAALEEVIHFDEQMSMCSLRGLGGKLNVKTSQWIKGEYAFK